MTRLVEVPVETEPAKAKPASKMEECQAALEGGRLLFIGIPGAGADLTTALKGAREFQASTDVPTSAVVEFGPDDAGGRELLRELGREVHPSETIVLFVAPPGILVQAFAGSPTKLELSRALAGVGRCSCGSPSCG